MCFDIFALDCKSSFGLRSPSAQRLSFFKKRLADFPLNTQTLGFLIFSTHSSHFVLKTVLTHSFLFSSEEGLDDEVALVPQWHVSQLRPKRRVGLVFLLFDCYSLASFPFMIIFF